MQLGKGDIHLFPVEPPLFCKPDIPPHLFKQLHAAQFIFQMIDGAGKRGLGNAQPGSGQGVVLHLGQYGEVAQIIVVHKHPPESIVTIYK